MVHDQGTGCAVDLAEFGVPDEPTVRACLAAGATRHVLRRTAAGNLRRDAATRGRRRGAARHPVACAARSDKLTLAAPTRP